MAVPADIVKHIADLAHLEFTSEEMAEFTDQFNQIIAYMDIINEADTDKTEPLINPVEMKNIFRDDEGKPGCTHEEALRNAPETDGTYFLVPKIINIEKKK